MLIPLLATVSGCQSAATPNGASAVKPESVPVIEIRNQSLKNYEEYPASIEGIVNSDVRAKVSGYILKVLVDEGQKVTKGQPLFQLETQTLTQDADAARAQLRSFQVEVNKLQPLVDKKIISGIQLETAKAKLEQAKSQYNSVKAQIAYAFIKSPIDGYVGSIPYRQGSLISPNDPTPLTTVTDISSVFAFFSMNEKSYLSFLQSRPGSGIREKLTKLPEVNLTLANGTEYAHKGRIETITAQVDKSSGTVSARATFPNKELLLTNGNSGRIRIPVSYDNMPVVPKLSCFDQQGKTYVFVVGKDNSLSAVIIEVLAEAGNYYIVSSGVRAGDRIVAKGMEKLQEKATISPVLVSTDSVGKALPQLF